MTPQEFVNELNTLLQTNITSVSNFIRVSLSSMKKSNLKTVHLILNDILTSGSSMVTFKQYILQCIDVIECKLYTPIAPNIKKEPPENICSIFFGNKGVELIIIARILRDPDIISSISKISWSHINLIYQFPQESLILTNLLTPMI